jgi:predicted Zn-dependent protease
VGSLPIDLMINERMNRFPNQSSSVSQKRHFPPVGIIRRFSPVFLPEVRYGFRRRGSPGSRVLSFAALVLVFLLDAPEAHGQLSHHDKNTERTEALFAEGQQDLAAHRDAAAYQVFRKLLDAGTRSAPVYSNLGVACLRTGRQKEALEYFQEARRLAPGMPGIHLNLGLAYFRNDEFAKAAGAFSSHLTGDPGSLQARYLRAICRYMMDDYARAVDDLLFIQDRQASIDYFFMLGVSLGQLKRAAESEAAFMKMIALGRNTSQLHLLLAQAYLSLHKDANAEGELNQALSASPELAFAHYYRGIIRERAGRKAEALRDFEEETELSPHEPWSFEHAGKIRLEQGDSQGALEVLRRGVSQNPRSSVLLSSLAKAYLRCEQPSQSVPLLEQAVKLEPDNGSLHYQLGRAYAKLRRPQDAASEMALAGKFMQQYNDRQVRMLSEEQELKRPNYTAAHSPQ